MKSFMRFLAGAALGFLVLSSGCKTITIRTILRSDDSLVRQITVAGDSTGIGDTGYPIRLHEPWSVSKVRDENDNNTYIYTISSSFSDIDELNEEIEYRGDSLQVNSSAELTKRFCWFYTFYRYQETFYAFSPFNDPPLKEYLSPEEFQLYQSGIDSSEIKDKVEAYAEENFYNAFANALIKVAANHPELSLTSADIEGCKEEIIDTFNEWVFTSEDVMAALLSAGDSLLHPLRPLTDYRAEFSELDSTFSRYFALLEKIITEGYRVEVEMPGRIFDNNANKTITRKMAAWEFETDQFHLADYTMWVESRRLNLLPTIITVLLFCFGLIAIYTSWRRSRRQKLAEQGISWSDRKKFIFKWPISIIFIILGGWLMFAFLQLFILFNIEPAILWLDIFTATPEENALFVFLVLLGLLLVVTGLWHLVLFFRERKNSAQ